MPAERGPFQIGYEPPIRLFRESQRSTWQSKIANIILNRRNRKLPSPVKPTTLELAPKEEHEEKTLRNQHSRSYPRGPWFSLVLKF